jgi:predicted TIM-barrel fold metal-dependent hydrolase
MAPGLISNRTTNGVGNGVENPDMLDSTSRRPTFYKQNPHLSGKIALEEHVGSDWFNASTTYPVTEGVSEGVYYHKSHLEDVVSRLADIPERIKQMDAAGIAITAVSLTSPGIQGVFDKVTAIDFAIRANDQMHKLYRTGPHAHRFRTWGSVAMQDPQAAAKEAERCVKELGCIGILINGFTNIGSPDAFEIQYMDEAQCDPFWAKLSELDVPLYLHPRIPAPGQTRSLKGYEFLAGSPWGFARETAEHCLRLMCSGLFDRYPNPRIVLGHCGEGLPFAIDRTDHRLRHFNEGGLSNHQHPLCYYFTNNFWITTAGVQKQSVLESCIREVGIDRVLFSMDYPMEDMQETAEWFDGLEMDAASRAKLAYGNAKILLGIK